MTQGIHSLTADMVNQLNKVDVITNNLANANTVGFKEDKLVQGEFNHYLTKMRKDDKIPQKESLILDTIPKIDGKYINDALGSITPTGNKLDFALMQEDLFFKIDINKIIWPLISYNVDIESFKALSDGAIGVDGMIWHRMGGFIGNPKPFSAETLIPEPCDKTANS